jgi:hypothetical protein
MKVLSAFNPSAILPFRPPSTEVSFRQKDY